MERYIQCVYKIQHGYMHACMHAHRYIINTYMYVRSVSEKDLHLFAALDRCLTC